MSVKPKSVGVGTAAPPFTLPAVQGGDVSLADFAGSKHVALVFLRHLL